MSDDERIINLEMALAHQQQEINDLSDMIRQHWARIEKLQRDIERLEESKADEKTGVEIGATKPPHY